MASARASPEVSTLSRLAKPPAEQTVSRHSGASPFAFSDHEWPWLHPQGGCWIGSCPAASLPRSGGSGDAPVRRRAELGPPEKKDLKIGFIPITCATPIIMAEPMGFYKKYGLNAQAITLANKHKAVKSAADFKGSCVRSRPRRVTQHNA